MEGNKETKKLSFKAIWQALLKHKYLFVKTIAATFVIACIITMGLPNYYKASVSLAPENRGKSNNSGLSSLASSFGFSLGSITSNDDALGPSLYPDMMKSVDFKANLFPIKVHELNSDDSYTYYEYIRDHQRVPWWTAAKKSFFNLFKGNVIKKEETPVNPFMLTKEQDAIIKAMNGKISCNIDKKTNIISISVTDQDPLVAATMADSVKHRLQDAITAYRTSKARVDLEYNKKLYEETKIKYDVARQEYAAYADANTDVILQRDRNKLTELENEMQLRYQAFSAVAAQLQAAEAKLQLETPAFTTLQTVTVPLHKAGPKRSVYVILFCFLAFFVTLLYVLHKECFLTPLFRLVLGIYSN